MRRLNSKIFALSSRGLVVAAMAFVTLSAGAAQAEDVEELYDTKCRACHTIGSGKLIGPDLEGVTERRDEEWLLRYIRTPKALADAGDPIAKELFAQFPGAVMPDQQLTEAQIKALLEYTKTAKVGPPGVGGPATPEDIERGGRLFQGTERLANGGAPCISCHDVTNDSIISGGVLAKELTTVFTRLGGGGVRAVLGSPPFPVMQAAYEDKALTDDEVTALVGFLETVNAQQSNHLPRDTGIKLAASGVGGTAVLLVLYSLIWGRRRRGSVNQEIYDRQVESQ